MRVMGMVTMSCQDVMAVMETCGWMLFTLGQGKLLWGPTGSLQTCKSMVQRGRDRIHFA